MSSGSSPRTWGTLRYVREAGRKSRFIPTYMGNAKMENVSIAFGAVHPHVHGERLGLTSDSEVVRGSSPRTWGTLKKANGSGHGARFIPTYMGNARYSITYDETVPVHPHVHGERELNGIYDHRVSGSSPRTWGTRLLRPGPPACIRFIPTYMGNAILAVDDQAGETVHPHVHGERERPERDREP